VVHLLANHRCTPQVVDFGRHVLAHSGQPADVVSTRPDGPHVSIHVMADEQAEAERVAALASAIDPSHVRHNGVAVLARTHNQLRRLAETLQRHGVPLRRRADAPGTPLAAAVQRATRLGAADVLRAWAHDILDAPEPDDSPTTEAERMLAAIIIEFLREQPHGNGAALRAWLVATDPFGNHRESGVELLTFHAAKGREWPTVVVTGVETGLVPHRSATTLAATAEEARLLYVAATRATHQLVLTRAERRGGYARRMSPLIELFEFGPAAVVPPPDELRLRRAERIAHERHVAEALVEWRTRAARRAAIDPDHLCTIDHLRAIARQRPRTAEDLMDITGLGRMTALALIDEVVAVLDEADTAAGIRDSAGAG
jgi:DNA helicase-2/ATP-dependent DNA helicase PcrA